MGARGFGMFLVVMVSTGAAQYRPYYAGKKAIGYPTISPSSLDKENIDNRLASDSSSNNLLEDDYLEKMVKTWDPAHQPFWYLNGPQIDLHLGRITVPKNIPQPVQLIDKQEITQNNTHGVQNLPVQDEKINPQQITEQKPILIEKPVLDKSIQQQPEQIPEQISQTIQQPITPNNQEIVPQQIPQNTLTNISPKTLPVPLQTLQYPAQIAQNQQNIPLQTQQRNQLNKLQQNSNHEKFTQPLNQYPQQNLQLPQKNPQYPQQNLQYHQQNPQYPQQNLQYPQKNPQYLQQNLQYPQQNPQYPQQTPQYPQQNLQYPQQNPQYPQQNLQYPQKNPQYPQQNLQYPQQSPQYPQQNLQYPQQSPQYPQQNLQYPQQSPQYPQQNVQYPQQTCLCPPQNPQLNLQYPLSNSQTNQPYLQQNIPKNPYLI